MLILNVPTGQMADRYGRKPVMLAGLGIMAVADIGTAVAKSMLFLIPTRLFLGVGRAACESGDRAYLADLTKRVPAKRGIITAAQAMVHGFGLVIGPLIGGSALDEYGPATAFYVVALAAVGTGGYLFTETLSESSGLRMKISLVQRMTAWRREQHYKQHAFVFEVSQLEEYGKK